ncbi:hypothetical protein ACFL0G_01975 [Candidatus Zixiibacteriota bacterium]
MKLKCIFWVVILPFLVSLVIVGAAGSQEEQEDWKGKRGPERFVSMDWLIGEWQGYGQFPKQVNFIQKKYSYDVAGMFFVERTIAMFPPEELSTDYEIHQDFSVVYRDNGTGAFLAKSFYVESFVTSSTVQIEENGNKIVIESENVENGPPGMRSRYSIFREDPNRYTATFEVAWQGKDFSLYEELEMKRVH